MTRERSGLIRLSMAFVEESDIGTYGLRVFNEHGEAYCEAALVYDGLEVRPGQSLGDCYKGWDKYSGMYNLFWVTHPTRVPYPKEKLLFFDLTNFFQFHRKYVLF